jgi:hypothetical protein
LPRSAFGCAFSYLRFIIQVDALAYRIPDFVEKCKRAGCLRVFIGLESVSPENLLQARKRQNKVGNYRTMLRTWRAAGILTFCGYILGFSGDSVASIERDIATIQRELPLDILEFVGMYELASGASTASAGG